MCSIWLPAHLPLSGHTVSPDTSEESSVCATWWESGRCAHHAAVQSDTIRDHLNSKNKIHWRCHKWLYSCLKHQFASQSFTLCSTRSNKSVVLPLIIIHIVCSAPLSSSRDWLGPLRRRQVRCLHRASVSACPDYCPQDFQTITGVLSFTCCKTLEYSACQTKMKTNSFADSFALMSCIIASLSYPGLQHMTEHKAVLSINQMDWHARWSQSLVGYCIIFLFVNCQVLY